MSLMSFPRHEILCDVPHVQDSAKITLTFGGTPNAPLAHSIDAGGPLKGKSPVQSNQERKKVIEKTKKNESDGSPEKVKFLKKVENMKKRKEEFLEKGILMALYGAVEQRVQCACMSTDHLLVHKRTRLRELLLAEEVAYTSEYVAACQQANASKEEELRKRAFELQTKVERERKQFVDQKLLEHVVEECDAARPVLSKKQLLEVKKDQLWQIKEKYALEEAKREEDKMFHDLMMKNMMVMRENEEEAAKLAWLKQRDTQKAFHEQMKWKEEKNERERQIKELERLQLEDEMRLIKEENEKEKLNKIRKKEEMKAELKELLAREREIKEKRKQEEREIDRTFARLMKLEEEKESMKESSKKEELKREMNIFLESSRDLKRQREEEEKKFNKTLEELNEKKRQQKDAERKKLKEAKEELYTSVMREREEQIKAKSEREKREQERTETEIRLLTLQLEQQKKIREDFERRCALQREEYRLQLLKQIEEVENAKRIKKAEEDEYMRQQKVLQDEEERKVKKILQSLPVKGTDHPFKTFINQYEHKNLCPYACPK